MAKEKVKQMTGVFASAFAHAGHITKEEAKEISGLPDHEFEKAYDKAASISEKMMQAGGKKMDKFLEHFAEEIEEYMAHFGGKLFD
ncbi:MAG: hypothetical protein JSV47_05280 [Deltaproteobacteria bacterium]|nr:MAG: hypothetical protein JSV47_05280 [Deltaproteobacteria bacterium]